MELQEYIEYCRQRGARRGSNFFGCIGFAVTCAPGAIAGGVAGGLVGTILGPIFAMVSHPTASPLIRNPVLASITGGFICCYKGGTEGAESTGKYGRIAFRKFGSMIGGGIGGFRGRLFYPFAGRQQARESIPDSFAGRQQARASIPYSFAGRQQARESTPYSFAGMQQTRESIPASFVANQEINDYISFCRQRKNQTRINIALHGTSNACIEEYNQLKDQIREFFLNKLGEEKFHEISGEILCPISLDLPEIPVVVKKQMYDHVQLIAFALSQTDIPNNMMFVPHTREIVSIYDIQTSYATQLLIERVINRLYEFKYQYQNNDQDNIQAYINWRQNELSNMDYLNLLLKKSTPDNNLISESDAIEFVNWIYVNESDKLPHGKLLVLTQDNQLPNCPMIYQNLLVDYSQMDTMYEPAYDVQNQIYGLISLAIVYGEKFLIEKSLSAGSKRKYGI